MKPRIGIIGGIGPRAGAWMAQQVVAEMQARGAVEDYAFPEFVLISPQFRDTNMLGIPPTLSGGGVAVDETLNKLRAAVFELNTLECSVGVIACNSAHLYFDTLQKEFKGTLVSLLAVTCQEIKAREYTRVGVLSSQSSKNHALWRLALEAVGCEAVEPTPDEQERVNEVILNIMGGFYPHDLQGVYNRLAAEGVPSVILGCTELSIWGESQTLNLIDPAKFAVKAALDLIK